MWLLLVNSWESFIQSLLTIVILIIPSFYTTNWETGLRPVRGCLHVSSFLHVLSWVCPPVPSVLFCCVGIIHLPEAWIHSLNSSVVSSHLDNKRPRSYIHVYLCTTLLSSFLRDLSDPHEMIKCDFILQYWFTSKWPAYTFCFKTSFTETLVMS